MSMREQANRLAALAAIEERIVQEFGLQGSISIKPGGQGSGGVGSIEFHAQFLGKSLVVYLGNELSIPSVDEALRRVRRELPTPTDSDRAVLRRLGF